jgi:hypothetical protein
MLKINKKIRFSQFKEKNRKQKDLKIKQSCTKLYK